MSKNDENQIHEKLEILSQIEPTSEGTNRAMERVRKALINKEGRRQSAGTRISLQISKNPIAKFAAAAVLLIAVGFIVGRLSTPVQPDVEELRAVLEPAIREDLLAQLNEQWQSAFAVNCAQLKEELHQQVRHDLTEFAVQTLSASSAMTNQRLNQLIELIEAARMRERQQVAAALEQMEQEETQLRKGLLTLAAQTNELRRIE